MDTASGLRQWCWVWGVWGMWPWDLAGGKGVQNTYTYISVSWYTRRVDDCLHLYCTVTHAYCVCPDIHYAYTHIIYSTLYGAHSHAVTSTYNRAQNTQPLPHKCIYTSRMHMADTYIHMHAHTHTQTQWLHTSPTVLPGEPISRSSSSVPKRKFEENWCHKRHMWKLLMLWLHHHQDGWARDAGRNRFISPNSEYRKEPCQQRYVFPVLQLHFVLVFMRSLALNTIVKIWFTNLSCI